MIEELKYILEDINCDDLRKIASKLKLERYGRKQELIDRIMAFYDKPNFVPNLYKELNNYEKEYIDTIVKQRYNPLEKSINEVHKKYKLSGERLEKTNCFFIQNKVPKFIREELDKLVPPFEITYHKTNDKIDFLKFYNTIEIEDKSVIYFDEFIKYINENKVKVTNKKRDLSKKDCLKFIDNFQIKEVSKRIDEELHNIKDVDDTVIMKGITDLLLSAHIINNDKDIFTLGSNYKKYIKLNKVQKIKLLLDSYIETNNINEIDRMRSGIYRYDFTNFTDIRDFLLEAILKLPINEWVNMEDFLEQIRMKDGNFIRRCLGNVSKKDDYDNWYYPCGYDEFDYPLIDVCLMNYFAVLGIVDVVISNTCDDRGYREYLTNSYVKLTNFGAVVLGLTKETDELIINNIPLEIENNKIIICDDSASMEHELFFDRFLEKNKIDGNIIYELNFKGIAKAIDLGITLDEIYNYLEDNTLELPIEIINDFNYYKKMLNKVKIRKVTILEYPKSLKEEIKNIKVISNNTEDTEEIIVVNNKKIKDIKASLEKKKIFCHILEK